MRRLYEHRSGVHRDDDDPFSPNEQRREARPQALKTVNSAFWSQKLLPRFIRHRAISVSVDVPQESFPRKTTIPFRVTMKNALPVPVTISTRSAVLWTWYVDDLAEASHVRIDDPPATPNGFKLERGKRATFEQRWDQMFRVSEAEWEPAGTGEYRIGAGLNVDDAAEKGLYDETTIEITPI